MNDHSIKCSDDENLKADWSRNKQHATGDSKAGQSAKLEDENGHRVCSRETFVGHLMKLAASQKYDKGKFLRKDDKLDQGLQEFNVEHVQGEDVYWGIVASKG